jgi:hypothetical protein
MLDAVELLLNWLDRCVHLADRVPSPSEPPDAATEQEADRFLHRVIAHEEWEDPSPEVATALIPRLRWARWTRAIHECGVRDYLKREPSPEAARALLEALLVKEWHQMGKSSWLAGEWK